MIAQVYHYSSRTAVNVNEYITRLPLPTFHKELWCCQSILLSMAEFYKQNLANSGLVLHETLSGKFLINMVSILVCRGFCSDEHLQMTLK